MSNFSSIGVAYSITLAFLTINFACRLIYVNSSSPSSNKSADNPDSGHGSCCSYNTLGSKGAVDDRYPLYFLVMAPYPDSDPFKPSWAGGPAVVPAAMVARDLINERKDILEDYTINFIVNNSGCNVSSKAAKSIVSSIKESHVVGIIGPACSESAIVVGSLVTDEKLSVVQIAPSATSPKFSCSSCKFNINTCFPYEYTNTYRPIVSALGFVDLYIEMIRSKNYQQVGVLYEDQRTFYTDIYKCFLNAVQREGIILTSFGIFNVDFSIDGFRNRIRIIFVFSSLDFARKILCLALKERMLYPNYQFVFNNRVPSNFKTNISFVVDGTTYRCGQEDMERALVGVLFANFRLTRHNRTFVTDAEISYNEFRERYDQVLQCHLKSRGLESAINTEHHSNYFDATWALALSLNNSLPRLKEKGLSLSNYTYRMPEITEIIREELVRISFEGMRGKVEFSEETHDGANVTGFNLYQVLEVDGEYMYGIIGEYDPLNTPRLTLFPNESLLSLDNFDVVYLQPHCYLGALVVIASAIISVALLICHIGSCIWRDHKAVKAASPRLNHLIFVGCYLSLIGTIMYTTAFIFIDVSDSNGIIISIHCNVVLWTSTMTFSLIFGTLCVKTWRIYCIFNKFNALPMKHLGDKTLIPIALLPLALDVIINSLWSGLDPLEFTSTYLEGPTTKAIASCNTKGKVKNFSVIVWSICVAIPKVLLISVVLYLAIVVRHVPKKEFKQTKSIAALIFGLIILTGTLLPTFIILQQIMSPAAVSASYLSFSLLNLSAVILCIIFLLLPPLVPLIKQNKVTKLNSLLSTAT